MTVQDLVSEARQLSLEERIQLLELLAHTLREEWLPRETPRSSFAHLRGVLKSEAAPPTDEEISDAYTEHLMEKYK